MRAVNLLPTDDARRDWGRPGPHAFVGVAGVMVVSTLLAAGFLLSSANVADKRTALEALKDELRELPPPPVESGTEATLVEEKKRRVAALGSALSKRVAWDRVLREFSLVLPDDVWLEKISATSPVGVGAAAATPSAGSTPTGFSITGFTYSQEAVARLLARLAVIPDLKNVQLQTSALDPATGLRAVKFTIGADLRAPGASS